MRLPPKAAALLEAALGRLLQGERAAVLAEDQELHPNDAAEILGVSRPLVVHGWMWAIWHFGMLGSIAGGS